MLFRETVKEFIKAIEACWDARKKLGYAESDPGFIFVHQANANILREVKSRLPAALADRMPILMEDIGNTVCASLPILRTRWKVLECLWKRGGGFSSGSGKTFLETPFGERIFLHESFSQVPLGTPFVDFSSLELEAEAHKMIGSYAGIESKSARRADCWIAAGGGFQTLGVLHLEG